MSVREEEERERGREKDEGRERTRKEETKREEEKRLSESGRKKCFYLLLRTRSILNNYIRNKTRYILKKHVSHIQNTHIYTCIQTFTDAQSLLHIYMQALTSYPKDDSFTVIRCFVIYDDLL